MNQICPNCQNPIQLGVNFCQSCGQALVALNSNPTPMPVAGYPSAKNKPTWLIPLIIIGIVLVLVVAGVIFYVMTRDAETSESDNQDKSSQTDNKDLKDDEAANLTGIETSETTGDQGLTNNQTGQLGGEDPVDQQFTNDDFSKYSALNLQCRQVPTDQVEQMSLSRFASFSVEGLNSEEFKQLTSVPVYECKYQNETIAIYTENWYEKLLLFTVNSLLPEDDYTEAERAESVAILCDVFQEEDERFMHVGSDSIYTTNKDLIKKAFKDAGFTVEDVPQLSFCN